MHPLSSPHCTPARVSRARLPAPAHGLIRLSPPPPPQAEAAGNMCCSWPPRTTTNQGTYVRTQLAYIGVLVHGRALYITREREKYSMEERYILRRIYIYIYILK
jgi:hypothetical protein